MFSFSSPLLAPPQPTSAFNTFRPSPLFHYTPQTPSPLRTSRNANIMSPPPTTSSLFKSSPLAQTTDDLENQAPAFQYSSPLAPSHATAVSQPKFSHETRARSNSPIASLSKHITSNQERRKNQFIDRLRSKQAKDDTRFEKQSEQVLRMDFVRERRQWEEMMARNAESEAGLVDEDMVLEGEGDDVDVMQEGIVVEGMSPPEDDIEPEELVEYLQRRRQSGSEDEFVMEDEEYERAMLEVLASQEMGQDVESSQLDSNGGQEQKYDGSMDMS